MLIELLQDPDLQAALKDRGTRTPWSDQGGGPGLVAWEVGLRSRIAAVIEAIPRIPSEVAAASSRLRADAPHGSAPIIAVFTSLVAIGLAAEAVYRWFRPGDGALGRLMSLGIFASVVFLVFFTVGWPPLARTVLLAYLCAFAVCRFAVVLTDFLPDRRSARRVMAVVGVIVFSIATVFAARSIGADASVIAAVSYLFSMLTAVLCVKAVLSEVGGRPLVKAARVVAVAIIWIFWCLELTTFFWLGVYAFLMPPLLRLAGRLVLELGIPPSGVHAILLVRAARAAVVVAATAWLGLVWRMNPEGLGHGNPIVTALFYGALKSVVVLLAADLVWQIAKNWIDRTLGQADTVAGADADMVARYGRLRTLLPILRNAVAVGVIVMTALVVLAELGVEVGPLVAGAGVFGVALGFGSQTLVKDVISGVFYMLDDAFRVGEYIQAKSYKGTVEGFSLRSVRLRHHRGPVFTVPFGELGAVENMSRDWGVVKFRVAVAFDTDLDKARKLTKKIGQTLLEDPEFGPLFIDPLKMKGLEEFGEYGLVLSFGMTLRPSPMQSFIRRRANLLLRDVFTQNGIEFATPSVQVGGGDASGQNAAAAAVAIKARDRTAKAESEAEV
ncbi:mechanosensitive ion channel family protein [Rhizobium wenxiniae]|uniref:mechanosensitive ion channel family protein n=1 Tax=Rhizobium wenxiniae TaxID=1737357 RepID=UPI001CB76CA4|nr:mechanosensitive ion channel family protein [Rhizobium wenxiniae]